MKRPSFIDLKKSPSRSLFLAATLLLAFSGFLFWSGQSKGGTEEPVVTTSEAQDVKPEKETKQPRVFREATLAAVTDNPDEYVKKEITVSGIIRDIDSRRLLRLEDEAGNAIYIITLRALTDEELEKTEKFLTEGAPAKVDGALLQMTLADVEERLEYEVSDETAALFSEPQLTLIAKSLEIQTN